jgi:serine/threonine protein phosphatase 1
MRTLVVGDIHGSAKALTQVLERSGFNPMYDKLICLGDYADGWSETSEVVDILLDIQQKANLSSARPDAEPIFIRGNHDVWVYDWMMFGVQPILWTQQGGKATIDSYIRTGRLVDDAHKNFWFKQHDWYIDDKNRLFIHGGWDYFAGFPAGAQHPVNAGSIARECHWDRSVLESARAAFSKNFKNPRFKALEEFSEVYIGHTAIAGATPEPENLGNLWNMDTGCGWYGVLSIMDIDTKEVWQSDRSRELYPNELGR